MTRLAARHVRVGALVLVCSTLFVGLLLFIGGAALTGTKVSYSMAFEENVKGMVVGSKVNFQGVPIGSVKDIRFEAGLTRVDLSIDPKTADIQELTIGRIDRLLVTGQVTIELDGWDPEGRHLSPGGMIPTAVSPIDKLTATMPELLDKIDRLVRSGNSVLDRVDQMLGDANQAKVASVLLRLDRLLADAPGQMTSVHSQLRDTLVASRAAADSVAGAGRALQRRADDPLVTEAMQQLSSTLRAAESAATGLARIERQVNGLVATADTVVGSARAPILDVLSSMRSALAEARVFVRQLRIAPSSLVFGRSAKPLDTRRPGSPAPPTARPPR